MIKLEQLREISLKTETKIVFFIMDGLGGLPDSKSNKTELESAKIPNLNYLAKRSICGLCDPVSPGITPGSGPGHLALFGYEPLDYDIGRGVLEALGIDFDLTRSDIAARGNFCTVDKNGLITDRRAGRISTEKNRELCTILGSIKIDGVELFIWPVKEHRFLFVMRSSSLVPGITDTDPQKTGVSPYESVNRSSQAQFTAATVNIFIEKAKQLLKDEYPANMILFRGFSKFPEIPSISEIYKLKPAAIASYPMYRGLAKLVGMNILSVPNDINEAINILMDNYDNYDYFFVHFKETDTAGEDGDFYRKVKAIEKVDKIIPEILDLKPAVIAITGDHSTPAVFRAHSWHPVPFMLFSEWCRPDNVSKFTESACSVGGLGRFPSVQIMSLVMANSLKFAKFGA